jgi:hypothetical protein
MPLPRTAAIAVLSLRIAYGAALVAAPARLTRSWLGPTGAPTEVALRGLGVREIAVHGAALVAAATGGPLRPWLAVSVAGDLGDVAATAVGAPGLPSGALPKTVAVAGASALLTAAVAAALDA